MTNRRGSSVVWILIVVAAILSDRHVARAQTPVNAAILKIAPVQVQTAVPSIPIDEWIAHSVIFLPKNIALQRFGYRFFWPGSQHKLDSCDSSVPYELLAEKTAKITGVEPVGAEYYITFQLDDGSTYTTVSTSDEVDDIVLADDISAARKAYLGKELWLNGSGLSTYDPAKDHGMLSDTGAFGRVPTKRYAPVTVTDVVPGWFTFEPIRFICKTSSGKTGYDDLAVSATNIDRGLYSISKLDAHFLPFDPRKKYKWNKRIWAQVEYGKVAVGMPSHAVQMSLGAPKAVKLDLDDPTIEHWIYAKRILGLQDGKVIEVASVTSQKRRS